MTRHYLGFLATAWIIAAMGIVGQSDYDEAQRQAEQYCKMVAMWKESGGEKGWPAYDGEEVCRSKTSNVLEGIHETTIEDEYHLPSGGRND